MPRAAPRPTLACAALAAAVPAPSAERWPPGERTLGLGEDRDGLVYVPRARGGGALPLVVFLHGAGGDARGAMGTLRALADRDGFALLVPESRGRTWDVIVDAIGPDVDFLGRALGDVLRHVEVDRARVALAGFSDGASYALTIGLANGGVFTHVVAFSPGFAPSPARDGTPAVFVSHGVRDRVLPIARCSREIVPRLRGEGYAVSYREFEGGHEVPGEIAAGAIAWFLGAAAPEP